MSHYPNKIIGVPGVQTVGAIATGVLAGYALQPVPEFMNKQFNENNILKFFILFIMVLINWYPLSDRNAMGAAVAIIMMLMMMEGLRWYETNYLNKIDEANALATEAAIAAAEATNVQVKEATGGAASPTIVRTERLGPGGVMRHRMRT